jgi:dTMP kinase
MTIAVDGIDGTGKGTQCRMLREALNRSGGTARIISFPVYESFFGAMISEYLNGRYGPLYAADSKLIALLFAMDRKLFFETRPFSGEEILIFDRYVLSNMAHQGVKLERSRRNEFFAWLKKLEFEINRIPYPDISIVLDMKTAYSVENVAKKQPRGYTSLTYDLHENDPAYQENTRDLFLELAGMENAALIRCDAQGCLRSERDIAAELLDIVNRRLAP